MGGISGLIREQILTGLRHQTGPAVFAVPSLPRPAMLRSAPSASLPPQEPGLGASVASSFPSAGPVQAMGMAKVEVGSAQRHSHFDIICQTKTTPLCGARGVT